MSGIRIIGLSIAFCIVYGVVLDQITARICVEYFTIGHPIIIRTYDPTQLGIVWGIVATWWVGLLLGIPLSFAPQYVPAPKRNARQLVRPMLILMMFCGLSASLLGGIGFIAASNGWVFLIGDFNEKVPVDRHIYFIADLWAHCASYFFGLGGGICLIVMTWRSRRSFKLPLPPTP